MRILFLSESPMTPSSMGKVTMLLASGLIQLGYEVSVATYSFHMPTPASFKTVFNPCVFAEKSGESIHRKMPCADIEVYPWGKACGFGELLDSMKKEPDALIVYSYPYAELSLNDVAYKFFTSRGKPALIYALHEGPELDPGQALCVAAYSLVVAPSQFLRNQYVEGYAKAVKRRRIDLEHFFRVLRHPVNTDLYSPDTVKELRESLNLPERVVARDCVVGMIAKNHIRKDYLTLVESVLAVGEETGLDIAAGAYWIDSVSSGYWSVESIARRAAGRLGISVEKASEAIITLPEIFRKHGLSEQLLIYYYSLALDMHLFLTRGEAYGLPPVESSLLGTPTASTDIPPQREALGSEARLVKTGLLERDDFTLWQPLLEDSINAVREFIEGKIRAVNREELVEKHDYRRIASELDKLINAAQLSPKPLSEKA